MFGNQQDTCLLQNSLLSAVKRIQSQQSNKERKFDLEDDDDEAIAIVSSTINGLIQGINRTNPVGKALDKQLYLQRRCHAALLFAVLKSNGIHCAEANKYYENIAHTFPTLSWKFFMKLNFHCKWSEYFIECSQDFQPDILSTILKKILFIDWNEEEHLKHYSWHVALQAIIWQFFIVEDISLSSSQDCCTFAFPFVSSDIKIVASSINVEKDVESFAKSQLLHTFVTLLNHLHSAIILSHNSFDFIKIVLHAYKTIFRLLSKVKLCEKTVVKELFRLNKLMSNCCSEEQSLNAIKVALHQEDERIPLSHYYAVTSWEINGNYLILILCNYWSDVLKLISEDNSTACILLNDCLPQSSEKDILKNICPLFKTKFEENDSKCVLFLRIIISLNYPCATRAAVILLLHPELRESNESLVILENAVQNLNPLEIYPVLADAVVTSKSKDVQVRLLKLFFTILSMSSAKFYNDVLGYILNHYGVNDYFQLDDFENQLNGFTRRMESNDESEKCLLPLFVQSPKDVLKVLIEQALLQGSNEITAIKILKHIPNACLHSNFLLEELKHYFIKDEVKIKEMNNMTCVVESLMKVHAEIPIIDFNKFLQEIIVPNLTAEKKVFFTLECLNVSLNVLVSKNVLEIKTEVLSLLIHCLSSIINRCIKLGDGRIKELAVTTLSFLKKNQEKTGALNMDLWGELSSYSPSVLVYISELFGKQFYNDLMDIESKSDSSWWIWFCNFKDINLFQETILQKKTSYEDLVSILVSVLPHLTKEEWCESAHLIREYFQISNLDVFNFMAWQLPNSDPHIYAVIRCLMDSYYFTVKKGVYDLNHISDCFTNTMQKILSEKGNLHLYLNVFLDSCHLTLDNMDEVYTSLLPFLLTVKKSIEDGLKDKNLKKVYLKLLCHGIKCLPNSEDKLPFFTSAQ